MRRTYTLLALLAVLTFGGRRYLDTQYREDLLTAVVCAECGICPPEEQAAVAAVILNREEHGRWGDLEGVVLAPGQFANLDDRCDARARRRVLSAVREAKAGRDETDGAMYFHARWTCRIRPHLCHHEETKQCEATVWPTLEETPTPRGWRHRYYREP